MSDALSFVLNNHSSRVAYTVGCTYLGVKAVR